ncbi:MAG: hypothetical protein A2X87_01465 [Deltaproteobacteria bacterium GWC2_42_51]|nr:MAG: hypothetical protein A2056_02665 [Deltaproteobacteria bacterium GWA2_42_85]OGP33470.1 MAG: hypothetical protein A2X87_01465 [Deltaproteobacteria bacterium GWC2_42_51]OGP47661.1 MAG: hypothetical protein A2022_07775 [Deltaproteobacteria bacterium GWF2_42_12]OGQ25823.1 MAG: hypothetical protein A3D29_00670 [Deltaproteobacteria bacterium RIFCSPHIGHO2_02_FULL_42_44]OGQ36998.1 MAG: hypothetical protein A3H47_02755 [Deltaproteobacteria bacterium RIFCSPLOWO2_02_FULL_42_39]OGQ68204.1 MAG: hypo
MKKMFVTLAVAVTATVVLGVTPFLRAAELADIIKDVKANGFVSTAYNYNFNDPDSRRINFRPFNENDDSFNLDVAELVFQKDAAKEGDIGFRTDIMYGYTIPKAIRSSWPGVAPSADDDVDIQQAYVRYVAPVGNGLALDLGKFITEMGAEVIEGYDAWNYNYSRSLLFYYTIPFTHTGLRGTYKFNDKVSLIGQIVNGWDNVADNNNGKTLCAHLMLTPMANTTLSLKLITGPEQTNNTDNIRDVYNINLTTNPIDKLTFNLDLVFGAEESDPNNIVNPNTDSEWSGVAGIVRYAASERYAINVRAEIFEDGDGARTGTQQDMWEVTVTPEFTIKKNLVVRPEYRHDASDKKVFDKGDKTADKKTQDTVAINVFFYF